MSKITIQKYISKKLKATSLDRALKSLTYLEGKKQYVTPLFYEKQKQFLTSYAEGKLKKNAAKAGA